MRHDQRGLCQKARLILTFKTNQIKKEKQDMIISRDTKKLFDKIRTYS